MNSTLIKFERQAIFRTSIIGILLIATFLVVATYFVSIRNFRNGQAAQYQDRTSEWTYKSVNLQGMGYVTGIVQNPNYPDEIYIKTDVGGAYRLNEDKNSWQPLHDWIKHPAISGRDLSLSVGSIAIDPTASGIVYATLGNDSKDTHTGSFWKSTNRGNDWTEVNVKSPNGNNVRVSGNWQNDERAGGQRLMVDPLNGNNIYWNTIWDGIFKSTDGGQNWDRIFVQNDTAPEYDQDFYGTVIWVDKFSNSTGSNSQRILAWKKNLGLMESRDAGVSWNKVTVFDNLEATAFTMSQASNGDIYISFDVSPSTSHDSKLWKYSSTSNDWQPIAPSNDAVWAVATDPNNAQKVIVYSSNGNYDDPTHFFETNNGGLNWTLKRGQKGQIPGYYKTPHFFTQDTIMREEYCRDGLIIDKSDSNIGWCADGYGVYRVTFDHSQNDYLIDAVMKNVEELIGTDVKVKPNGQLLLGGWDMAGFLVKDPNIVPSREDKIIRDRFGILYSINYAPSDPNIVYAVGNSNAQDEAWAVKSLDGGQTWQYINMPVINESINGLHRGTILVSPTNPNHIFWKGSLYGFTASIWAEPNNASYFSLDGGQTWQVSNGLPTRSFSQYGGKPTHTINDRVNSQILYNYDCIPENDWQDAIYRSDDEGKNWSKVFQNNSGQEGLGCDNDAMLRTQEGKEGYLWMSMNKSGSLFLSKDKAQSFDRITGVEKVIGFDLGAPSPGRTNPSMYLVGQINGIYGVYISPDLTQITEEGGDGSTATWLKIASGEGLATLNVVAADPTNYGKVYMSTAGRGFFMAEYNGLSDQNNIFNIRLFLSGNYNPSTGLMSTQLLGTNLLPQSQPYNQSPWNYNGNEVRNTQISNIVDWILLDFQNVGNSGTISKAALLKDDGTIINPDGSELTAPASLTTGNYNITIRHRNHLPITTSSPVNFNLSNQVNLDFSINQNVIADTLQIQVANGVYALRLGDVSSDNIINSTDRVTVRNSQEYFEIYSQNDINLDGIVNSQDRVLIRQAQEVTAVG